MLGKLSLDTTLTSATATTTKSPIESWDDVADADEVARPTRTSTGPLPSALKEDVLSSDCPNATGSALSSPRRRTRAMKEPPAPPPPTPVSPRTIQSPTPTFTAFDYSNIVPARSTASNSSDRASLSQATRPEKTTAVANRLIAGALGVRPARRTDEQKAYDKAVREQELRKRTKEREDSLAEERRREQAKKDIWDG